MQVHLAGGLGDGAAFDAHGVADVGVHQVLDGAFDGGREEHGLAAGGHGRHDALDGGQKAHVEHAVGFIENQDADAAEVDQRAAEKIVEPAGGGDGHLGAAANGVQLRVLAEAAHDHGGADAGAGGHLVEGLGNLDGELPRGAQDQRRGGRAAAGSLASVWITGRTKASVFPVPVSAVATRSRPASAGSMARAWTGVSSVKFCLLRLVCKTEGQREFRESFHSEFRFREEQPASQLPMGERGLRIDFSRFEYSTG